MGSSSKVPKLGEPSSKKMSTSSQREVDEAVWEFRKDWGSLKKLQDRELEAVKKGQARESISLQAKHTTQLNSLRRKQWKQAETEVNSQLEKEKKRQSKEWKKCEQRQLKELEELEGRQRKVLLETADLMSPISYPDGKISKEEMTKCNLKEYKLSEVVLSKPPPEVKDLSVDVMVNDFLMGAFSLKDTYPDCFSFRANHLFPLKVDPGPEFSAVLQGLVKYAELVPPQRSLDLFPGSEERDQGMMRGWLYLVKLGQQEKIPYFLKMRKGDKEGKFVKRMIKVMGESGKVEICGFKVGLIGYTYGFWLAKLYNKGGIEDEQLPLPLWEAKQHFMEYPWDPTHAHDAFHYDHFPVNP